MPKLITYLLFLSLPVILAGCTKDGNQIITGKYTGSFTVNYLSVSHAGNTTVELMDNGQYHCTGNPNYYPAGGSGSFTITGNKISFKDMGIWTANFDGNLILNGEYDYTFDGTTLIISAFKNSVGQYVYTLTKQ